MISLNVFGARRWSGIAAGALVVALAACGSQAKTVEVRKAVSPQKAVLASVRATTAAKSARVSLHVSTDATGAEGFALTADGVADFTTGDGALTMQFTGAAAKLLSGGIEVRTVDGAAYVKMPESLGAVLGGGKWLKTPDLGANSVVPGLGQSDPTQFLAYLETVSSNVTKVGPDTIRGVETTHYKATLDLGKAVDRAKVPASLRDDLRKLLTKGDGTASAIPVDVWVDADGLARRVKMQLDLSAFGGSGLGASGGASTISMSMDLYDFGVPVHVEAPPAGDIQEFPFGPSGAGGTLGTLGAPA